MLRPPPPLSASPRALSDLLLSLSASRSLRQGQQFHAYVLKSGYIPSVPPSPFSVLSNHLITFYSRCSLPLFSYQAFLDLPSPPCPAAWSALLSSLSQNGLHSLALSSFRSMLLAGVPPNDRSLPSAAKSVASFSDPSLAQSLHALALKTPFSPDVFTSSSLLDMYAKCSLLSDAQKLFDLMPERNFVSWSALICGYADAGHHAAALNLFRSALHDSHHFNEFTFSIVIRVCAEAALLSFGAQIQGRATKSGLDTSPFVGSSLISLYSKCGLVNHAYRVFDKMPEKNLGAWNATLIASAQHGHTQTAFNQFESMQASGFQPDHVTFLCLLTACSHSGLVEEGKKYFALMPKYNVKPGPQHYTAMVDLLGRVGKISEALSFIDSMPVDTPPTESVWGSLLSACRTHKDPDIATLAAEKLLATGSLSTGAHLLLVGTYQATGQHFEAANVRKAMRDAGVRKETGLSWLEAGGQVHSFASGDRKHEKCEEIYKVLEEVGERMEAAGYVPDTSGVLREVRYHSERLAIGLGLLVVSAGVPIRVMKNLRVCNDCHTAIKYLTKCTGRIVVLRDNRRFHRFEDGACSCGDFW